ncbi:MAG: tripartite tricarboxylate transporter substrate-binding protein [Pseudomonadota bacterium]
MNSLSRYLGTSFVLYLPFLSVLSIIVHSPAHAQNFPPGNVNVITLGSERGMTASLSRELLRSLPRPGRTSFTLSHHRPRQFQQMLRAVSIAGRDATLAIAGRTKLAGARRIVVVAFAPVCLWASSQGAIDRVGTWISRARQVPQQLKLSGAGKIDSSLHRQLDRSFSTQTKFIPFKGRRAALNALLAGDVDMAAGYASKRTVALSQSGQIRAIACLAQRRHRALPSVPTLSEEGTNLIVGRLFSVFGPAAMSAQARRAYASMVQSAANGKQLRAFMQANMLVPLFRTGSLHPDSDDDDCEDDASDDDDDDDDECDPTMPSPDQLVPDFLFR